MHSYENLEIKIFFASPEKKKILIKKKNVLSKHPTLAFSHRVQNSVLYICVPFSVYLGWNRSPAQAGCMRQVLGPGALGRPRGIGWRGRWEGGLGWGTHVNPWLIHVSVWQTPLQYCKVISLQLIKINEKKWMLHTVRVI